MNANRRELMLKDGAYGSSRLDFSILSAQRICNGFGAPTPKILAFIRVH